MSENRNGEHGPQSRPQKPMFDQDAAAKTGGEEVQNGPAAADAPRKDSAEKQSQTAPDGAANGPDEKDPKPVTAEQRKAARTKQQKNKRRIRIALVALLVVVVLLVAGFFGIINWAAGMAIDSSDEIASSVAEQIATEALPEYHGKGIVAGLICGIDYNNEDANGYVTQDKVGNTDMILYVMFDTVNYTVNILQIPRDMYVGEDVNAGQFKKINGVYNAAEDPSRRMTELAKVINDQFQLPIDFYIKLDLDAMKALVDHAGSIEVYIPQDVVDPKNPDNMLQEGWRHLTGDQVEFLVRNRNYPDGDVTRLRMQQSFYSALFREFKRLSPWDLVMWMRILLYYVDVGGLDVMEIGGLAQKALNVDSANVTFVRPPYAGTSNPRGDGQDYVYLLPEETAEILNEYFRTEGHEVPAEDLNIHTFPEATYGTGPAEVKTMGDIQEDEPPMTDG